MKNNRIKIITIIIKKINYQIKYKIIPIKLLQWKMHQQNMLSKIMKILNQQQNSKIHMTMIKMIKYIHIILIKKLINIEKLKILTQ